MTVYKNMAFGLKMRGESKEVIKQKVHAAAKILDIEQLLERKPKQLSGGQRQRVALGRAMVRNPAVFLLDEPLSNLDAKLRTSMRTEISKLHKQLETTFVYVTHDQIEAMTMGDRIVVMKDGFIQQVDTPQNLYSYPVNLFVAGFIGAPQMNFMDMQVQKTDNGFAAKFGETIIPILPERADMEKLANYIGKEVTVGIRPEHIHIEKPNMEHTDYVSVSVNVDLAELMGAETYLYSNFNGVNLIAKVPPMDNLNPGDVVKLALDCTKLHLFDPETGVVIR